MRLRQVVIFLLVLLCSQHAGASDSCVVLQYHHFSDKTPRITSVTPSEFQAHLDYLKKEKFNVLPLDDIVNALKKKEKLPDKCVSITVDDAYDSVYKEAFPRLKDMGWPMTVFVNTESIDQGVAAYMTWEQVREMAQQGVRFENHSHSHLHLVRKTPGENQERWRQRVMADIQMAQDRISHEIGRSPQLFAYPYGEYNLELKQIVRGLGLTAFGQQSGPIWRDGDFTLLPRFPMAAGYAAMNSFKTKVSTLPLPVIDVSPADPIVPLDEWHPVLTLVLKPGSYDQGQLTCYANGSADVEMTWPDDRPGTVEIRPNKALHVGRNRYNCTMPSAEKGGYHWFSHTWIRREPNGDWYKEY